MSFKTCTRLLYGLKNSKTNFSATHTSGFLCQKINDYETKYNKPELFYLQDRATPDRTGTWAENRHTGQDESDYENNGSKLKTRRLSQQSKTCRLISRA